MNIFLNSWRFCIFLVFSYSTYMNIAVLTGGISTERPVALRSAANIKEWIEKAWSSTDTYDLPEEIDSFLENYKKYDLIVPVFHGRYGEDGIITAMCEAIGMPIAWCPSHVHALCIDKYHTNCVVEKLGIKVPKTWIPGLPLPAKFLPTADQKKLDVALIIKPNQWGSSLATTKAKTFEEFQYGIQAVHDVIKSLTKERIALLSSWNIDSKYVRKFPTLEDIPMVQECIEGREFTVGVYKDALWTHVLPIIEIITLKWSFFDYEEKYETDGSNEVFSDLEAWLKNILEIESTSIYNYLDCRGIVRMDWRYDEADIYFLEVNTIPGFTSGSLVPKMWKRAGKSEKEFVEILCM